VCLKVCGRTSPSDRDCIIHRESPGEVKFNFSTTKLTGLQNLQVLLKHYFLLFINLKLGCFVMCQHVQARTILELKTRLRFRPASWTLSMPLAPSYIKPASNDLVRVSLGHPVVHFCYLCVCSTISNGGVRPIKLKVGLEHQKSFPNFEATITTKTKKCSTTSAVWMHLMGFSTFYLLRVIYNGEVQSTDEGKTHSNKKLYRPWFLGTTKRAVCCPNTQEATESAAAVVVTCNCQQSFKPAAYVQ